MLTEKQKRHHQKVIKDRIFLYFTQIVTFMACETGHCRAKKITDLHELSSKSTHGIEEF